MDKIIAIAQREFLATVRTKAFILTVAMMPAIMVAAVYGGQKVQEMGEREQIPLRTLAVCDQSGRVLPMLQSAVERYNGEHPTQKFAIEPIAADKFAREALAKRVNTGALYGWISIPADAVTPGTSERVELARKDTQLRAGEHLEDIVNEAIRAVRFQEAQISPLEVARLSAPLDFARLDARTAGPVSDNKFAQVITPFVFMLLLFMGIFSISQGLLTTVIEEKGSRVIEVLLSAVSPLQLLTGKILGTVLVGFLLLVVWGSLGAYGAQRFNVAELVTPYRVTIAALYFVPGFLLMASLLAAIGSACNELKEAQSMVFPLSILTIIPMLFWFFISEHPASIVSVLLSYVPPITPFIMILRVCSDPDTPLWQIASTLAVLWASVVLTMWAAAKIFRIGVLMYGKHPSPRELLRWVRYT